MTPFQLVTADFPEVQSRPDGVRTLHSPPVIFLDGAKANKHMNTYAKSLKLSINTKNNKV